jgi:hypothetical protein
MLIRRVQQARWVQAVHELAQPIETCHNWQRIPGRSVIGPDSNSWSSRPPSLR